MEYEVIIETIPRVSVLPRHESEASSSPLVFNIMAQLVLRALTIPFSLLFAIEEYICKMIRNGNTLLTEMAVPSKIFCFSDLSTISDIVAPFINTSMISRCKLLSNRIIPQYGNSSINCTGRIWRKRQVSFVQGNVVSKGVTAKTRRLHNRLLILSQRYRDNNTQLDDFLRGVGRNIRVCLCQEQE